MLLCLLLSTPVLARGSTLSTGDLGSVATTSLAEDWAGTTGQLQPDLQTEAQTQAKVQREDATDTPTMITTSNYTGQSLTSISVRLNEDFYTVSTSFQLNVWSENG